jgi:heptosyltransferase-2
MKVLIIQPAFLGDAIISLALAEEFRRLSPESEIAYLVRPEVAPIIMLSPSVNKVLTYDKYNTESGISGIKKKAVELNAENFDTIFTLHSSKRTRMLLERLNAPVKVGYGDFQELTHKVTEIAEQQTSRAIRLLLPLFPDADLTNLPKLQPSETSLLKEILQLPRPIIAIAPDSVWLTKQWGIDKFSKLINLLNSLKFSIILIGSNKQVGFDAVGNHLKYNGLNLLSKTSLTELISVISYCDLLISNDSAPVHIATATRTPSIVVFGPTVPEFGFAPPQGLGAVIQVEGLWCRPCASHGSNECPIHTHGCMNEITPEAVFEEVKKMLQESGHGA